MSANVLIIDDNEDLCRTLARKLTRDLNLTVEAAYTLSDGSRKVREGNFDVVFLDVMMPDGNGVDILPAIKNTPSSPEVIIITGRGESEGAAMAINNGAWDYVPKGASLDTLVLPLERALQFRRERTRSETARSLQRDKIIGAGPAINACLDVVAKASGSDSNVLIEGETGVGKELFARAIHENSGRKDKKLVVVDCAGIPETLIESALFGHEKGAYTGADRQRKGLISEADGGTLFLDEIGELSPFFQKAFLRVIQEKTYRNVGGDKELTSDFRVVAATNRDLNDLVEKGFFRKDLLFRVNTITLKLPPLRDRTEDVKHIAIHYIAEICDRFKLANKGFSPEFMDALTAYDWPGNVRELVHVLERAIAMSGLESTLLPQFLPSNLRLLLVEKMLGSNSKRETAPTPESATPVNYREFREAGVNQLERQYLINLMGLVGGDVKKAATLSGLSLSRLYKLLKKHDI